MQLILFLAILLLFVARGTIIQPNWQLLALFPVLLLLLAGLSLGFGIIISSLTTKYRDLAQLVAFSVHLWMYATPVIYPSSIVPERFRTLYFWNPMAGIIEGYRSTLLTGTPPDVTHLARGAIATLVLLISGCLFFKWAEPAFADLI